MTLLDSLIAFVVVVSALIGVMRGFLREVLSIAAWLVAIVVAFVYHQGLAAEHFTFIDSASLRPLVAFSVVFVLVLAAAMLTSHLLHKLVTASGLMPIDRVLGLVFGALRGGLIVAAVVVLVADTSLKRERWWRDSMLVDGFEQGGRAMLDLVPEHVARQFSGR